MDGFRTPSSIGEQCGESPARVLNSGPWDRGKTEGVGTSSGSKGGDKLRVTFDHVGGGLVSRDDKPPSWFEIIGQGTDFVPAEAKIDGDSVVLSSSKVKQAAGELNAPSQVWIRMGRCRRCAHAQTGS